MSDELMSGGQAGGLLDVYAGEPVVSRREAAPHAFAAIDAVLLLHEETELEDARRGHWEGHGSNERWVRDKPKWCPVCNVEEPCETRQVIIDRLGGHR
jgi:hypothetical protein